MNLPDRELNDPKYYDDEPAKCLGITIAYDFKQFKLGADCDTEKDESLEFSLKDIETWLRQQFIEGEYKWVYKGNVLKDGYVEVSYEEELTRYYFEETDIEE